MGLPPASLKAPALMNSNISLTGHFDAVVTSPPYANRYDYTRTYALELAYLGYNSESLKKLRQTLLSATVENKSNAKR